jgi:hypothetical protein
VTFDGTGAESMTTARACDSANLMEADGIDGRKRRCGFWCWTGGRRETLPVLGTWVTRAAGREGTGAPFHPR